MDLRDKAYIEATKWLGVPWVHGACNYPYGVDCVNFIIAVGKEIGSIPDSYFLPNYSEQVKSKEQFLEPFIYFLGAPNTNIQEAQDMDIVIMRYRRTYHHAVFILPTTGNLIHASSAHEKVIVQTITPAISNRFEMFFNLENKKL